MASNPKKIKVVLELSVNQGGVDYNYINRIINAKLVQLAQDSLLEVVEAKYTIQVVGGEDG